MNSFTTMVRLSSVPLVKLGADLIPVASASGCWIDYRGKRILLTVAHATKAHGNWAIQLRYEPGKGTQHYRLGAMHFLAIGTPTTNDLVDLDFSYVETPRDLAAFRQEVVLPSTVRSEVPITVHEPTLDTAPAIGLQYGFCGVVAPVVEEHPGLTVFNGELAIYTGLSYVRSEGDYRVFRLPMTHPGHQHIRGCSGSPVLDELGEIVGLVCDGDEETDEVRAFNVGRYKVALDILVADAAGSPAP